jgi:hypothetical protein
MQPLQTVQKQSLMPVGIRWQQDEVSTIPEIRQAEDKKQLHKPI